MERAAVHTEAGPGLLELNVAARRGPAAADDAADVKFGRQGGGGVARAAGELPREDRARGGGVERARPPVVLERATRTRSPRRIRPRRCPRCSRAAVAGVLERLPAASLLLNPTRDSYKRLVPGWFAPMNVSWGNENRSCAVRAIGSAQPDLCRIECRRPGADANPYLALAALAASVADGIRRGSRRRRPSKETRTRSRSCRRCRLSRGRARGRSRPIGVLRQALGERFSDYYATSRAWELKAWRERSPTGNGSATSERCSGGYPASNTGLSAKYTSR